MSDAFAPLFHAKHSYELPGGFDSIEYGRAGALVCEAIGQALRDAGLEALPAGVPVIIGTGLGESRTAELAWIKRDVTGPERLTLNDSVRREFGATDVSTISNACAASLYALAMASDLLASGEAEQVVVAGVDIISISMFGLLDRVHPEPPESLTPFNASRKGVLMGEGAVAVVVSKTGTGVAIEAVALGCDAFHVTAPSAESMAACIRRAHRLAEIDPDEVDLVVAHGTGTVLNDKAEGEALSVVWRSRRSPVVTALKGATGHTSGGSGLFSLVMAAECLRRGVVPPILGLETPDDAAGGLDLVSAPRVLSLGRIAQINAFGFGGLNAVAVISKDAN
jgi:3-oxoacyl-[acyl-carrier-protein] synthase II